MEAYDILRRVNIRATPRRIAILEQLLKGKRPLSAEALHARVKDADLVTIYRTLEQLHTKGIVRDIRFKDGVARYEFAHGSHHHHHLVCTKCGQIDELPECDVRSLEKTALAASKRFKSVEEHALEFFGTCVTCAK